MTALGRSLSRLPVDPRLGRMILAAEANGCVEEAIVVAAGLTVADPRRRPEGDEARADQLHSRFDVADSDLSSILALWRHLARTQRELGSSALRRRLRDELLDHQRVREWQDLVRQLREVVHELGIARSSRPDDADALHRSVLAGLLSQIGMRDPDGREYRGARQSRFVLGRSSVLRGREPAWVMAAELVETDRLRAHRAAKIDPAWVEPLAAHLVRVAHGEPRWDAQRGTAVVDERVTLHGLPVVTARPVAYERIDPAGAHALFVRHAVRHGDGLARRAFHDALDEALDELARLQDRLRRADLVPDDDELVDLLSSRLPVSITSRTRFERWWRGAADSERAALAPSVGELLGGRVEPAELAGLPDRLDLGGGVTAELTYLFDPGEPADGVVAHVSLAALGALDADRVAWGVPGRRHELVTALLRALPKDLRRRLGPAPEVAAEVLAEIDPGDGALAVVLAAALRDRFDVPVEAAHLDPEAAPAHLRPIVQVEDPGGEPLAWGRDVAALAARLEPDHSRLVAAVGGGIERSGLVGWPDLDPLPEQVSGTVDGYTVRGYPALVDEGETVGVRVLADPGAQRRAMTAGTRRLALLVAGSPHATLVRGLAGRADLVGVALPGAGLEELVADSIDAAVDRIVRAQGGPAFDGAGFSSLAAAVRGRVEALASAVAGSALDAVVVAARLEARLAALAPTALDDAVVDMTDQLHRLFPAHFVARTGLDRVPDLARYLRGVQRRIDTLVERADRDAPVVARIVALERRFAVVRSRLEPARWADPDVEAVRWSLEELRISLLAQVVGAKGRVSEARVAAAIEDLAAGARHPSRPT